MTAWSFAVVYVAQPPPAVAVSSCGSRNVNDNNFHSRGRLCHTGNSHTGQDHGVAKVT